MTTQGTTTTLRRCIGSTRFRIETYEAPENEFPAVAPTTTTDW